MKFEKIKPGMTLLDCHMHTMGNTTLRAMGVWRVEILTVDADARAAMVNWNGNRPQKYHEHELTLLREHPPEWMRDGLRGPYCYYCRARQSDGHRAGCEHPKAKKMVAE